MKRQAPTNAFAWIALKEVKDLGQGKRLVLFHRRRILRAIHSIIPITPAYRDQTGMGLVETLVAVAILGTCTVAFASGLSAGSLAASEQRTQVVAQELAQNELEYIKDADFVPGASTYPIISSPESYTINVVVGSVPGADTDIQKITVSVLRDRENVVTLADYKVNR